MECNTLFVFQDSLKIPRIYGKILYILIKEYHMMPFISGYRKMIDKAKAELICLPKTKEGQNKNISEIFLREFDKKCRTQIEKILKIYLICLE